MRPKLTRRRHPLRRPRAWISAIVTGLTMAGSLLSSAPPAFAAQLSDFGEPFHFLSPLGVESGDPTKFDPTLLDELTVSICRIEGTACTPEKTLTSSSSLSERLRLGPTNGTPSYYIANWDTSKVKLAPSMFRVTVTVDRLQLGSIDVPPAQYKSFGRTWPIKFRIENNPKIRVRVLNEAGKSASQIANVLKREFQLGADDIRALLAGDLDPFTDQEIDVAINGVFQDVVLPPTTKIADDATGNALTAFDPATGRMTFAGSTGVLADLKVGDVLVGEPNAAAANGYLRKVTAITALKKGAGYIVETTQAHLDEAVTSGTLDAQGDLHPDDLAAVQSMAGVSLREAPSAMGVLRSFDVGDGFDFHETIDVTLDGSTGDPDLGGVGTVHIQGEMKFNAGWNVGLGIESCLRLPFFTCVDRFEAHLNEHAYAHIHVTGNFNGWLHKEVVLSTQFFQPIVFFIGPIPVVIVPVVKAIAGVDGTAHVEFSFEGVASSDLGVGGKWTDPDDGGNRWEDVTQLGDPISQADATASFKASMDLRGYAKADAKLLLYGIVGPGVAGQLGLRGFAQFPGKPAWTIYGYAKGQLNFGVDIGGILTLSHYEHDLLGADFEFAHASNLPPACSAAGPATAEPGVSTFLGPRTGDSYQGFFACSDPEGDPLTYSATSSDTTPPRAIAVDADSVSGTWATPGTYTVHVTAKDSDGATKELDVTVDVQDAAPILSLVTASTDVPAESQYWVTASAFHPSLAEEGNGDFMDCDTMTWDVPGATVRLYASHRVCTALITFAAAGAHTVTVTATDAFQKYDVKTINVNVTAAPANPAPEVAFGTFNVVAASGPIRTCQSGDIHCDDACPTGFFCPVPMDALLYNGSVGNYHGPLTFWLTASDPNGDPVTVTWHCAVGSFSYPITDNGDGTSSCDPYSSTITQPILVWADVSDGTTTIHSEVRRMYMLDRVA